MKQRIREYYKAGRKITKKQEKTFETSNKGEESSE